jgi:ABC-type multidrug transport system ATPase subunit
MAYLPQQTAFPPIFTVKELMEFAAKARRTEAREFLKLIEAMGLDAVWNQEVGTLSGGWSRRLGLAVALIPPTQLVLLDEPFVGLDPETLDRLLEHLGNLVATGAVILLASHEFEIIDLLQPHLAVLENGKLLEARSDRNSRRLYREVLTGERACDGQGVYVV